MDTLSDSLELQALKDGSKRYHKQLETASSRNSVIDRRDIKGLLSRSLPKVSLRLREKLEEEISKHRASKAVMHLKSLDTDLLALVGLSGAFRIIGQNKPLASVCMNIGYAVDDELWARDLHQKDPKFSKRVIKRAMKEHHNTAYRRKAVKAIAKKEGILESSVLSPEEKVHAGGFILDAILQAVPEVFETYVVYKGNKHQNYLGLTVEASKALLEVQELQEWMHPAYKPMVTPPKPWASFYTGCYHNPKVARSVTLIRTSDTPHVKMVQEAIKDGTMKYCLEALNIIQSTRWQINKPVLDLVKWVYENPQVSSKIKKFPQRNHLTPPERPADYEELPKERQKGWRIVCSKIAKRNRGIDSERIVFLQDIHTAESLQGVPEVYIPHNLDFRGRVYPVPHFNQQRADYVKACLHFAEGKVLTEAGAYWLAVHLANSGDFGKVSKKPFDTRVQWVSDNEELIFSVADNPYSDLRWIEADKPFSFYAACVEWAGFRRAPEAFRSRIAVAMDGSNSGLQHFACAMRSLKEGQLVNLTPQELPADLYQTVADIVKVKAASDAENGDPIARIVAPQVTRSLVKRNVMTFAYSSEEYGFRQQHMEDTMRPLALDVLTGRIDRHPFDHEGDDGFKAAAYLAKTVWKAVNEVVTEACHGMSFFRRCATSLAHEGKGLSWVTPVGLPVLHLYSKWKQKRIRMFLQDREVSVFTDVEPTSVVEKDKAANAVSPNVIHSLDSAALMLCVLEANDQGVQDFSLIHDSFGAHPNDTEVMYVAVRQSLIDMYENYCPFEELRRGTYDALDSKDKAPRIPDKGQLDLGEILKADYAFA